MFAEDKLGHGWGDMCVIFCVCALKYLIHPLGYFTRTLGTDGNGPGSDSEVPQDLPALQKHSVRGQLLATKLRPPLVIRVGPSGGGRPWQYYFLKLSFKRGKGIYFEALFFPLGVNDRIHILQTGTFSCCWHCTVSTFWS